MCLRGSDWLYIDGYWFEGEWMVVWEDGNKFEFIGEDVIYYSSVSQELIILNAYMKNEERCRNNCKMANFIGGDFC